MDCIFICENAKLNNKKCNLCENAKLNTIKCNLHTTKMQSAKMHVQLDCIFVFKILHVLCHMAAPDWMYVVTLNKGAP